MDIKNIGADVKAIKTKYAEHAKKYLEDVMLDDTPKWKAEEKKEVIVEETVELKNIYSEDDPFMKIISDAIKPKTNAGKTKTTKQQPIVEEGDETEIAPDETETEMDPLDAADDALKELDLNEMETEAKIELINSIIDNIQNSVETDEEFSDAMNKIQDIIDGYAVEDEEEAEVEEPAEDEGEEETPEQTELPPAKPPVNPEA